MITIASSSVGVEHWKSWAWRTTWFLPAKRAVNEVSVAIEATAGIEVIAATEVVVVHATTADEVEGVVNRLLLVID